jgi:hypothetical protein
MNSRIEIWERQASDPRADRRSVLPDPRARQSVTGHIVRYVLGFGLAGAIIALVIVYVIT